MQSECIFCQIITGKIKAHIVFENKLVLACMDIEPINRGHMLIMPKSHKCDVEELSLEEMQNIMLIAQKLTRVLKKSYPLDGYSMMQNGGAFNDIGHYHMHLFPRYLGDGFGWTYGNTPEHDLKEVGELIRSNLKLLDAEHIPLPIQYQYANNLNARIYLHQKFSIHPTPWTRWVFDQFDWKDNIKILEIGCGTGSLWKDNAERISEHWDIRLTDKSNGMLETTQKNLESLKAKITYSCSDADELQLEIASFDIIIANHMLYHLKDIDKTLSQIYQALKPNGIFYATTIGDNNLLEMKNLVQDFTNNKYYERAIGSIEKQFSLTTGIEKIKKYFSDFRKEIYYDALVITEVDPLVDYVVSLNTMKNDEKVLDEAQIIGFKNYLQNKMDFDGKITIQKESGIFICYKNEV